MHQRTQSTERKSNLWNGRKYIHIISCKGLISRIHKELLQLNNFLKIILFKNWQRIWIGISPKIYKWPCHLFIQIWKKRCSTALIIKEVQIKTIVRYYLTFIRMATIKYKHTQVYLRNIACSVSDHHNKANFIFQCT